MTFGVKDYTTEAPTLQPFATLNAERQFDRAELNRFGFKDLAVPGRDRASASVDLNSTFTLTQEVRTTWISSTG